MCASARSRAATWCISSRPPPSPARSGSSSRSASYTAPGRGRQGANGETMPPHRNAYRPVVMGRRGVVTSAHPLASMAGIRVLLEGGNAVDAAVAVGAALNVVEPFMSSAAGIGLMTVSRGGGRERLVLDFVGRAPRAADVAQATLDEMAGGPKACAIPGNMGGWLAALERFGSMPRERVLAPAIDMAENGVPLTWMSARFIADARATLQRSAEAQRLYLGNGG